MDPKKYSWTPERSFPHTNARSACGSTVQRWLYITERGAHTPPNSPIPHLQPVYWESCGAVPGAGKVPLAYHPDRS